jgi:hypothetical protein
VICPLCPEPLDQAPLTNWEGLPAHADCVRGAERALDDAVAMILAEPNPRRHRHHVRP